MHRAPTGVHLLRERAVQAQRGLSRHASGRDRGEPKDAMEQWCEPPLEGLNPHQATVGTKARMEPEAGPTPALRAQGTGSGSFPFCPGGSPH